jgi:hypothetical protein
MVRLPIWLVALCLFLAGFVGALTSRVVQDTKDPVVKISCTTRGTITVNDKQWICTGGGYVSPTP